MERSGDEGFPVTDPATGSDGVEPDMQPAELGTARMFAALAAELQNADGVIGTVGEILRFASQATNCSAAGMVLVHRDCRAEIAAVTDPSVEQIYDHQIQSGAGPLITAVRSGQFVSVLDTLTDHQWPTRWQAEVRAAGFRSVLHLPLRGRHDTIAVLSLYGEKPGQFSDDDRAVADLLVRHATAALAAARTEDTLQYAIDTRDLIGQAKGILMERFSLDADRAFAVLRRYSQTNNTKLRDVATELTTTRTLPAPPATAATE